MNIKKNVFLVLFLGVMFSLVGLSQTAKADVQSLDSIATLEQVEVVKGGEQNLEDVSVGMPLVVTLTFKLKQEAIVNGEYGYNLPTQLELFATSELEFRNAQDQLFGTQERIQMGQQYVVLNLSDTSLLKAGQSLKIQLLAALKDGTPTGEVNLDFGNNLHQMIDIKEANPGFFELQQAQEITDLRRSRALISKNWTADTSTMAEYFRVLVNTSAVSNRNPYYSSGIESSGYPYYFWGLNSWGQYLPNQLAMCVDIFHPKITGAGQWDSDLAKYIGKDAAEDVVYTMHMGATLAENAGMNHLSDKAQYTVPKLFNNRTMSSSTVDMARLYMFRMQTMVWQIAASNNVNIYQRLVIYDSDFTPQYNLNGSGFSGGYSNFNWAWSAKYTQAKKDIEALKKSFKDLSYLKFENETPTSSTVINKNNKKVPVDEYTVEQNKTYTINVPAGQQLFLHTIDTTTGTTSVSKNLDLVKIETINNSKVNGSFTTVKVTPIKDFDGKQVVIGFKKNTADFWNSDNGKTGLISDSNPNQYKAIFTMPEALKLEKEIILNMKPVEKTSISGEKKWLDDGKNRPNQITVSLLQNGQETGQTQVVTAANNWKYEFTDLVKYDESGKAYEYSVKEITVPGYESHVDGTTITNIQLTALKGEKKWFDDNGYTDGVKRPDQITVHLYRKLKESSDEPIDTKQVQVATANNNWKYEFTNLPKYDETGKEYEYSIKEDAVPGYDSVVSSDSQVISNYAHTEVEGEKKWEDGNNQYGTRPKEIVVQLLQNEKVIKEQTVKPDQNGNWTYTFTDLPMYDQKTNQKYSYTVKEKEIPNGYTFAAEQAVMKNGKITANMLNTYQPEGVLPETGAGMTKQLLIIVGASVVLISLGFVSFSWYQKKNIINRKRVP
ncbi:Cna B-type domain-containing protein [uncultured Enterococcus sp.]|uniref:Cna B-type domain-containing protein n=1 Tax=uncultured Enterococcus sp. TaxID=167972 RepID=UPI0025CD37A2|nr:Cna B-type domain-containing protein [uncultured Enterococcus sp.]